ncbi:MAG TPA: hypothetical protein VK395_29785 [Gemmataceae bacterium]|nr:hypothetical protein [Gemmataceae bacterium]
MSKASEAIFSRPFTPKTEIVSTPEWGPDAPMVEIRELTSDQLERWEWRTARRRDSSRGRDVHFRASAIIEAAFLPGGEKLLVRKDVELLAKQGGAAIIRLYAAFRRTNGLDEEQPDQEEPEITPPAA